jgi:hypothetical protein
MVVCVDDFVLWMLGCYEMTVNILGVQMDNNLKMIVYVQKYQYNKDQQDVLFTLFYSDK